MGTQTDAPRRYHHGNLREALLRRAEEVLAESGAGELSLRGIARDVGVSHAAPRRHFADKQALLDALAEDGFGRLAVALDASVGDDGRPFVERLAAMAEAYVGFAVGHAALLDVMFTGKHRPGVDASLLAAGARAFQAPLALVVAGQASGDVVPGDVERVATSAWAAIHGLASMANAGLLDAEALPGIVADTAERLVLGLRPRG
ncbi:TetR/AcrR family transcriptional regulator [Patulibacter minatonensis]|uniref:TetR/AcrR family transcriptional regulator n=1 Tax=Patulibacter minatonensis TaxID=298163 RepID=UPI00047E893B|nr:TetR/AcrR family transcriptional regulator [Patulibacter minatonensis]